MNYNDPGIIIVIILASLAIFTVARAALLKEIKQALTKEDQL